jgi:hypothetical protein
MLRREIVLLRVCVLALCAALGFVGVPSAEAHVQGDHIPGVTTASVIAYFEAFGLTCDNNGEPNGVHPPAGQRGADCSGSFPDHEATATALINYWDDGHVVSVWTTVGPRDPNDPDSSAAFDTDFAFEWSDYVAELPYTGADPEETKAWVRERAASGECGQGCALDAEVVRWFMAATDENWPGQLDLDGQAPVTAAPSAAASPSPALPNTAVPEP